MLYCSVIPFCYNGPAMLCNIVLVIFKALSKAVQCINLKWLAQQARMTTYIVMFCVCVCVSAIFAALRQCSLVPEYVAVVADMPSASVPAVT